MITPIRALYDKVEDQVAELKKYLVFYNSEVFTIGPIINGITCSMEEARANGENVTAGYKQGKTSLLKILKDGTVDKIINSFSIVGLMVVGSMAATRVAVDTPLAIKVGEGVTKIQTVLNSLAPGLIPLGITMLVWWMLRKKVNTLWIIVAIFVVGIIGYYTGILGYVG